MATPTIETTGAASSLLKITTQEGIVHRVTFVSGVVFTDTSNSDAYRIDISHARGEIILIYSSAEEVAAALMTIDELY